MSKIFFAVGLAVAVATLVLGAGEITFTECSDSQCKVGCRAVAKIPEADCRHRPFQHEGSMKVVCGPAPNAMCVYAELFRRIPGAPIAQQCQANSSIVLGNVQCNTCFKNHIGEWEMITGCNAGSNLTVKIGCDATCTTCKHTFANVPEKTCIMPDSFPNITVGYSAPQKCGQQIVAMHYNVSDTCNGTSMRENFFANTCYGRDRRSHYYKCSS
jgi:hypothetical protein